MSELIGRIIALGATLILVVIAVGIGSKVFSNTSTVAETQNLNAIVSNIHSLYANQPNYNGLNTSVAMQAGVFPSAMVQGGSVVNKWGGSVSVAEDSNSANEFDLTYTNIPQHQCVELLSNFQSSFLVYENVDGTDIYPPVNPSTASSACKNSYNTVVWVLK